MWGVVVRCVGLRCVRAVVSFFVLMLPLSLPKSYKNSRLCSCPERRMPTYGRRQAVGWGWGCFFCWFGGVGTTPAVPAACWPVRLHRGLLFSCAGPPSTRENAVVARAERKGVVWRLEKRGGGLRAVFAGTCVDSLFSLRPATNGRQATPVAGKHTKTIVLGTWEAAVGRAAGEGTTAFRPNVGPADLRSLPPSLPLTDSGSVALPPDRQLPMVVCVCVWGRWNAAGFRGKRERGSGRQGEETKNKAPLTLPSCPKRAECKEK